MVSGLPSNFLCERASVKIDSFEKSIMILVGQNFETYRSQCAAEPLAFKESHQFMKHLIARILHWFIVVSMAMAGLYLLLVLAVIVFGD